jgi:hypothetical protein
MSESDYRTELEKMFPLDGVGTRFDHYSELREVFADGIEIMTNMRAEHRSAADVIKLAELKAAEKLIAKRLEVLSGYERKMVYNATLPSTIRQVEIERLRAKLLLEGNVDADSGSVAKDKDQSSDIT